MSLRFLSASNLTPFVNAVVADPGTPTLVAGGSDSGTGEVIGTYSSAQEGWALYLTARDRYYACLRLESTLHDSPGVIYLDPSLVSSSPPQSNFSAPGIGGPRANRAVAGQFDPSTGAQKLYVCRDSTDPWHAVNLDTCEVALTPAFTGANGDHTFNSGGIVASIPGGWLAPASKGLFFEGLTQGVPGETDAVGVGAYPGGLYWTRVSAATLASGRSLSACWVWIDPLTRRVVGRPGGGIGASDLPTAFPARADAAGGEQTEAPIALDEFEWNLVQFVPDPDASYSAPKGELLFISHQEIPARVSTMPGDVGFLYVRFIELNPFGVSSAAGIPTRTHGRIRFQSRLGFVLSPQFDLAGQDATNDPRDEHSLVWDPIRRRFAYFLHDRLSAEDPGSVNSTAFGLYARAVQPDILSVPIPQRAPPTNGITDFAVYVSGDIGEPVEGQAIDWTLRRVSTQGELVVVTGGIGTTSNLDQVPADEGSLVLIADGVPLEESTDYTIDEALGVITWLTDQQGAVVLAEYDHRTVPVSPARGTLLASQTTTDALGYARTQVAYADDLSLVAELEQLDADLS